MKTKRQTTRKNQRLALKKSLGENEWVQKYADRIYQSWFLWKSPFGVASSYIEQIKIELHEIYSDPLKRVFTEESYA